MLLIDLPNELLLYFITDFLDSIESVIFLNKKIYLLYKTYKNYIYKRKLEIEYPFFNNNYHHYKFLSKIDKKNISLGTCIYVSKNKVKKNEI